MNPTRLRGLIRKYGDPGVLLVACCIAGYSLWARRRSVFGLALPLLICVYYAANRVAVRHLPVAHVPLVMSKPPLPAETVPAEDKTDKLEDTIRLKIEGDRWQFEQWWPYEGLERGMYLKVFRNDQLLKTVEADELGGVGFRIKALSLPTRTPVVGLLIGGGAGHPSTTRFYTIRKRRLVHMGDVGGEYGGPIILQVAGQREWLFDDYCWYLYYSHGPKEYLIYEETREGKLELWKSLPNPQRKHLPNNISIEW